MKLKNHIDWNKNKFDICLTKARRREREKGKQEIDSHKRAAWEVVKENPSLAATGRDQIPSHVTALLFWHCFFHILLKSFLANGTFVQYWMHIQIISSVIAPSSKSVTPCLLSHRPHGVFSLW